MKIISLVNAKGGVGKTTSAISIAALLSKKFKVLLIDLDQQGNATGNSGIDEDELKYTSKDIFLNDTSMEELIIKTEKGYDLIGANIEVADTSINLVSKLNREYVLKKRLKNLNYDYVILDCSPAVDLLMYNALVSTNIVLIPVETHMYSLKGISSLLKLIEDMKELNENIEYKFFITKYDARLKESKELAVLLRENLGEDVCKTIIRTDNHIKKTQNESKHIYEVKGLKSPKDYKDLVKEVLNV
jgi:chromosome partitioning protein